jgi:hypothetical protein
LLNYQWSIEEIREEIKRFLEANENENNTHQNIWDTAKAVLKGKFIVISAHIKRTERAQINDLMLHLKLLEKQEQVKPRREIIRAKIKEIQTKKHNKTNNQRNKKLIL